MARQCLARCVANPLRVAAELARYRDDAQRLVRSAWAQHRIRLLANALLEHIDRASSTRPACSLS